MLHMPFLGKLARDEQGATIVEFGLLAIPLFVMILGGIDLGYQNYVRSLMQGALNDAARLAAVEDPDINIEGDTPEEKVENLVRDIAGTVALDATITVTSQSYFDFSEIGNPEALMTDVNGNGAFDEEDGDCWEDSNGNGEFDTDAGRDGIGGSDDVVFYTANVQMPRLLPLDKFINVPSTIDMSLETAIRNQPYGTQANPPVLCGTATP